MRACLKVQVSANPAILLMLEEEGEALHRLLLGELLIRGEQSFDFIYSAQSVLR